MTPWLRRHMPFVLIVPIFVTLKFLLALQRKSEGEAWKDAWRNAGEHHGRLKNDA